MKLKSKDSFEEVKDVKPTQDAKAEIISQTSFDPSTALRLMRSPITSGRGLTMVVQVREFEAFNVCGTACKMHGETCVYCVGPVFFGGV